MADQASEVTEYQLIGPAEDGETGNLLESLNKKEGRQRLQALLSDWMRMDNLVVLAGAGTSVSSGGKTMVQLEESVLRTVRALADQPEGVTSLIDGRLAAIDRTSQPPSLGFEAWLSYLVSAAVIASNAGSPISGVQWKGKTQPSEAEVSSLVKWLGKSIYAECALILPDGTAGTNATLTIAPHIAFLAKLVARDSNLGRTHLFTLNYDTLFEQALELLGIQYFDGFTGRADARFDPSVYGLDIYYPGEVSEGRVRRFDKFLHLYKLHGSIHWEVRSGELRARHPDLTDIGVYRTLTDTDKAAALEQLSAKLPTVGILPTANKFAETLSMPFAHLFRSLQVRLSVPQTFLLILGYGFGDDHVTRIIETALMNPSLIMLVVEPNPSSAIVSRIRRYRELGKRAFVLTPTDAAFKKAPYTTGVFDDFARSIMPDVRWLEDFLRLRRFEKLIRVSGPESGESADSSAGAR
jgi:hypothetical protein